MNRSHALLFITLGVTWFSASGLSGCGSSDANPTSPCRPDEEAIEDTESTAGAGGAAGSTLATSSAFFTVGDSGGQASSTPSSSRGSGGRAGRESGPSDGLVLAPKKTYRCVPKSTGAAGGSAGQTATDDTARSGAAGAAGSSGTPADGSSGPGAAGSAGSGDGEATKPKTVLDVFFPTKASCQRCVRSLGNDPEVTYSDVNSSFRTVDCSKVVAACTSTTCIEKIECLVKQYPSTLRDAYKAVNGGEPEYQFESVCPGLEMSDDSSDFATCAALICLYSC